MQEENTMKKISRTIASFAAAAVAASSAVTVSAFGFSDIIARLTAALSPVSQTQTFGQKYITPMTVNHNSTRYKNFTASAPSVSVSGGYWSHTLEWKPVTDALLYYVYGKDANGRYTLIGKTADTQYYINCPGNWFVRAVTYDYNDRRITSRASSVITVEPEDFSVPEYEDYWCDAEESISYAATPQAIGIAPAAVADGAADNGGGWYGYDFDDFFDCDNEEYTRYAVDGFRSAAQTPLSTFSADVDTASYANVRRMVLNGNSVTPDAVRIEEFLNYFDYDYTQPVNSNFSVTYEYTDCPWNKDAKLLMLGVQAKDVEKEPDSNLVFLIDVSGSMYSTDKLPLVVDSLKKLTNEMTKNDRISIVTYSGQEKVVISGARGNMKNCIAELADTLEASGCTNGEAGINMAYDIAARNFIKGGSNRVILATDGDLNVGISDKDELSEFIAKKRDTGVYLTVLGFGTGNLKDDRMEALAKEGNGNYHYIDCATEASKVLVDERKATLITVADDVKLQVEFNPTLVDSYRLIGYDGRRLANEDFTDDRKDAADMGAGQSITVMYEIIPAKSSGTSLTYQTSTGNKTDICTLSCRYKEPGKTNSSQFSVTVKAKDHCKYADTGIRFKFAACVCETAMALRNEDSYGNVSVKSAKARFDRLDSDELTQIGYSDDFAALLAELG